MQVLQGRTGWEEWGVLAPCQHSTLRPLLADSSHSPRWRAGDEAGWIKVSLKQPRGSGVLPKGQHSENTSLTKEARVDPKALE